jgi:hypothetical protein
MICGRSTRRFRPTSQGLRAAGAAGPVVLLRRALTAFAWPGEKPPRVGGMGYTARLVESLASGSAQTWFNGHTSGFTNYNNCVGRQDVGTWNHR